MQRRMLGRPGVLAALAVALASCSSESTAPDDGGGTPAGAVKAWSSPGTWPMGALPKAGDSVVIPTGVTVRLDTTPPAIKSLTVNGTLVFADKDLSLTSGWILVKGTFQIGTAAAPYRKRAVITLIGTPENADVASMGNKVLGVTGKLELHGETRGGWTHLNASASAGATGLVLEVNPGWRIGDRLVVASTDYDPNQAEEVVVTGVSGKSITLAQGLRNAHYGLRQTVGGFQVDERAEVGLLTRNITIKGDTGTTPGYGGHTMVMAGAVAHVEGVEFFQMGQRGHLARYPMHWHMAGDVTGQYFRNNSVWRTFNRCVTIHGSDNAVVSNNVCYDHTGHGYFMEDGAESGNTLDGNLGLVSRIPQGSDRLLGSDGSAATFWITNPDNSIRNNVAGGSKGVGFWCAFPASPTGLSTGAPDLPRTTPLREFKNNVAHSNNQGGLFVDNGPKPDGNTETTYYAPHQDPADNNSPMVVAHFDGFRAYKHQHRAVWFRGNSLELVNAQLADNGIGATFAANETFVKNSVFIGSTPGATRLPPSGLLKGYEFYDGRVGAEDVTFVNYSASSSVPAGALGYNRTNAFPISPQNFASNLTFVNANQVYIENPVADKDGDKAAVFLDADGAVTGTVGRWVAANVPILLSPACSYRAQWNSHICSNKFLNLSVRSGNGEAVAPLTVSRDDAVSLGLSGTGNDPSSAAMSVIPSRGYTLQFAGALPPTPRIYINDASAGDWVRVSVPLASAPPHVVRDYYSGNPVGSVASLAELNASNGDKYYYDAGAHVLHLKLVVQAGRDWATMFVTP